MSIEKDPTTNMNIMSFDKEEFVRDENGIPVAFAAITRLEETDTRANGILLFPVYTSSVYPNIHIISAYPMVHLATDYSLEEFLDLIETENQFIDDIGVNATYIDLDLGDNYEKLGAVHTDKDDFVSVFDQDNHRYAVLSSIKYLESCIKSYATKENSNDTIPVLEKTSFRIIESGK